MNAYGRDFGGESGALRPRKTLVWVEKRLKNLVVEWSDPVAALLFTRTGRWRRNDASAPGIYYRAIQGYD
jgi:hypothetical protein